MCQGVGVLARQSAEQATPGAVRLVVSGDIDGGEADELLAAIVACDEPGVHVVSLDLAGVTFMGSSGIGALIRARQALGESSVVLRIDACSPVVDRVLEIAEVRAYFGMEPPAGG